MPETLLTPSSIKMFGRVVRSLSYRDDTEAEKRGCNNFLQHQLACRREHKFDGKIEKRSPPDSKAPSLFIVAAADVAKSNTLEQGMIIWTEDGDYLRYDSIIDSIRLGVYRFKNEKGEDIEIWETWISVSPEPTPVDRQISFKAGNLVKLARIYSFSFEGAIYSLPKPSIFIVHGYGIPIDVTGKFGNRYPGIDNLGRTTLDQSGVMAREWEFSAAESYNKADLRYWEYEKGDFSMRFDTEAGQLEQILLVAALRAGADMADRATGIRSGASLAGASLSGASLSGASLSGASLSGASLSGASLSGASLRGR
jgi:Pentapeptide repeats (8 copies)